MLKIRDEQQAALEENTLGLFSDEIAILLRRKYVQETAGLPLEYLRGLSRLSIDTCLGNGLDRKGTMIEFAEAMLRNSVHPMDGADLAQKAAQVLSEFRSRELFQRLQAMRLAATGASTDAEDGAENFEE